GAATGLQASRLQSTGRALFSRPLALLDARRIQSSRRPTQQETTQQEATQRETNPAGNNPAGGNPATAQFQQELSSATIIRNGKPMNHIEETDESHRKNR
ncbi:MAG: hypothetical protein PHR27_09820, partial [Candidatus Cloacimonetes bacterium]|nr:hypothetical protein [Candidatus Cloacimonadota bacterium]